MTGANGADPPGPHPVDRGRVIGAGVTWLGTWSLRVTLVALGLALVVFVIGQLWVVFLPVFLGVILATLLRPPVAWLTAHRIPPAIAALAAVVGAFAVLAGVALLLVPVVVGQAGDLAQQAATGIGQIQTWLSGSPLNLGNGLGSITGELQRVAPTIASTALTGLSTVASGLLTAVLAVVLAFLFVKDGPRFLPWVRRAVGAPAGPHLEAVLSRSWDTLGSFVRIQALVGLMDAVLIGLGLFFLGVPLALPLAVLIFFAAFVPIAGATLSGALAVLVALVAEGLTAALIALGIVLVVQQLEGNVFQPILQGRSLRLHPAVVLLAVTAGGARYGIAGAFLAVPVAAVAGEVLRYLGEQVDARTRGPELDDVGRDPGRGRSQVTIPP